VSNRDEGRHALAIMEGAAAVGRRPRVLGGLHRGLTGYWYPIMRSGELAKTPVKLRRFAEDLAVWRDTAGRPHVFENRCPHRGAPLALGKVRGEELQCWYHGWRFTGTGACSAMPLEEPDSPRPARTKVKAYAAEDRGGYIWMFYGEQERATPLEIPGELEDDTWCVFRADYLWKTNWLNILDNVLDPLHAIFLHVGAYTQRKRAKFKSFQIRHDDENGFRLGKIGYLTDGTTGPVEGEVEFRFPNVTRLDLADGTPQGIMRVVVMPTPIDENTTLAFYMRSRKVKGLDRLRWQIAWYRVFRRAVNAIAHQDELVMSEIGDIGDARMKEHLSASDVGVIHLRKRLNQAFIRQTTGQVTRAAERIGERQTVAIEQRATHTQSAT
jgi:phenylpropionate dioxygenase-like ring-hydroxylating dioxygenase large terminal subunit